jgi:sulfite reductase (NADPH) flavoprotein alpha-component
LFGSQSGNSESLAKKLAKEAKNQGYDASAMALEKVSLAALARERCALVVTSTWGEGDPPDNAVSFWKALQAQEGAPLTNLSFSVLALGDKNYEQFCGFGKKIDKRLEELGAKRIFERIDCPVNFEEGASRWQKGVFEAVSKLASASDAQQLNGSKGALMEVSAPVEEKPAGYSRKNPFQAPVCSRIAS